MRDEVVSALSVGKGPVLLLRILPVWPFEVAELSEGQASEELSSALLRLFLIFLLSPPRLEVRLLPLAKEHIEQEVRYI